MEQHHTSQRLLAAAAPLFAKNGFAAVTIRELSQAAKVNGSLISYYFGGKEGLYSAVLESQFHPLLKTLDMWEAKLPSLPAMEQLRLYADAVLLFHCQHPLLSQLLFSELLHPTDYGQPIIQNYLKRSFWYIHRILEAGIQSGDFRSNLPVDYVKIMWYGMLNFHSASFLAKNLQSQSENYTAYCIDMLLNGIIRKAASV